MSLSDLLAQNRAWAAAQVARDPDYFLRMTGGQHPRVLWIGCSDSRVPAEQVLGCGPGDLFVHRNVANIVAYNDINIAAVVQFATHNLGIEDVVVCGHYGCGGIRAACAQEAPSGYIGDWLAIAGWAQRAVDARLAASGPVPYCAWYETTYGRASASQSYVRTANLPPRTMAATSAHARACCCGDHPSRVEPPRRRGRGQNPPKGIALSRVDRDAHAGARLGAARHIERRAPHRLEQPVAV